MRVRLMFLVFIFQLITSLANMMAISNGFLLTSLSNSFSPLTNITFIFIVSPAVELKQLQENASYISRSHGTLYLNYNDPHFFRDGFRELIKKLDR